MKFEFNNIKGICDFGMKFSKNVVAEYIVHWNFEGHNTADCVNLQGGP